MTSIADSSKSLKILNASAGSGKTYNLVKEYVKLLVEDPEQTKKFNQIIAMTFTNMAALEMKTRIVSAMDMLSHPDQFGAKAQELAEGIDEELKIGNEEIFKRSRIVMKNILHSYEDFSVMTIDKFNLRLIRSFSRDLDLPADFEVVLNESQVIEQVVDLLLSNMGTEEMKEFTRIAINYSKENLEEGEAWDFKRSLIAFGSTFSKEKDQPYLEALIGDDLNEESLKKVRGEMKELELSFSAFAKEANDLINSYGVDSGKYPQGSNFTNRIAKLNLGLKGDTEVFTPTFKKTFQEETPKGKFLPEELRFLLIKIDDFKEKKLSRYLTLQNYSKNFYNMSLLKFMAKEIDEMKKEERIIRISEFNKLISSLVRQEEAPFIYERLGNRFQHFLLDEFQDTSRLQWLNMVPLLHESLSQAKFNLIVGDPKQSIYRFKNGVAEQFVELPGIYNPEKDPDIELKSKYFEEAGYVDPLPDNWRSSEEIVLFNNELFENLRNQLPDRSKKFYNSVKQNVQSKHTGFVRIQSGLEKEDQTERIQKEILAIIDTCLNDDYHKSDICLLAETNKAANEWALVLKNAGHKIISAESLLIDNDLKVNLTISFLKRRLKPSLRSEAKKFAEIYFRCSNNTSFQDYSRYIAHNVDPEGKTYSFFNSNQFITEHFGSEEDFFFNYENIYDLIQGFYSRMNWDELKDPYLHHLADFVYDFELSKGPDLAGLLDLYEEKKGSLAIQTPSSDDAIIVMTVHKSKGLEFPVVIIPSCDFDVSVKSGSRFLVESEGYLLHTTLAATSKISAIQKMHQVETEQILTDKMNLCYVAMTRPELRLYAFNSFKGKGFGSILHGSLEAIDHTEVDGMLIIERGKEVRRPSKQKDRTKFYEPVNLSHRLWFPDIALSKRKDPSEPSGISTEQRFGNQFHLIMAELTDINNLERIVNSYILNGTIDSSFKNELLEKVQKVFEDHNLNSLFEGAIEHLNEQNIIADEENTKRPDKVIVKQDETLILDYKTGIPKPSDVKQMMQYINLYTVMGYTNVKGYLYYTSLNELRSVG